MLCRTSKAYKHINVRNIVTAIAPVKVDVLQKEYR